MINLLTGDVIKVMDTYAIELEVRDYEIDIFSKVLAGLEKAVEDKDDELLYMVLELWAIDRTLVESTFCTELRYLVDLVITPGVDQDELEAQYSILQGYIKRAIARA